MNIQGCLDKRHLIRIKPDKGLIMKEITEAEYDLNSAKNAMKSRDYKWAIVKGYYSMFHAARAVLFSLGYRERRHYAVQVVLEQLGKEGKLESVHLDYYSASMEARENADYRYSYSEATAGDIIGYAEKFLERMKELAKQCRL